MQFRDLNLLAYTHDQVKCEMEPVGMTFDSLHHDYASRIKFSALNSNDFRCFLLTRNNKFVFTPIKLFPVLYGASL